MKQDVGLTTALRAPVQGRSKASYERMLVAAEGLMVSRGSDDFTLQEVSKKGKVSIEFVIKKDGTIAGMNLRSPSGDVALDRAAWGGITASVPFAPLPGEYHGPYLALRFHFYYNPAKGDIE